MGLPILVLGYSGSGKSASLRNFKANELALVNVNGNHFRSGPNSLLQSIPTTTLILRTLSKSRNASQLQLMTHSISWLTSI